MVLTAALSTTALLWYGEQSIDRVDVPGLAGTTGDGGGGAGSFDEALNVLVVGTDNRDDLSEEELAELGTETNEGLLTDTIMLVQLDPRRDGAAIISFPRDLLVNRCDGSEGRINAAYAVGERTDVGGPSCLVETVTDLTGIAVNNYVEVDFSGFIDVVETLGGVTMYLDKPLRDRAAGLDLSSGCVSLNGTDALSFVRARHLDNDFGRIARQQRFLKEIVDEVMSAGTLVNVPRLASLIQSAADAVEVDSELSLSDMRRLASSLRGASAERLETRTVPAVQRRIDGAAYVVADDDEAEQLFSDFEAGRLITKKDPTEGKGRKAEASEALSVSDIPPIELLNGVGVNGLAAEAETLLEDYGLEVADTDNADDFDHSRTRVLHPSTPDEAEVVAELFEDPKVSSDEDVDELTVVLGSDFELEELRETIESQDEEDEGDASPGGPPTDGSSPGESSEDGSSEDEPSQHRYAGAQPSEEEEC